jgi:hypothetical protein
MPDDLTDPRRRARFALIVVDLARDTCQHLHRRRRARRLDRRRESVTTALHAPRYRKRYARPDSNRPDSMRYDEPPLH